METRRKRRRIRIFRMEGSPGWKENGKRIGKEVAAGLPQKDRVWEG
jgi:hypothetical protein